jgi:hypothetical protein
MNRRVLVLMGCLVLWVAVLATVAGARGVAQTPPSRGGGWTIPPTATEEKSPLTVNQGVLDAGKKLFTDKCQRVMAHRAKATGPRVSPSTRRT